ncbi:MAG TPA: F0F1 ATP synthase subunit gamma [Thermoanaerobaculia bacterium]|nr:F0F1 ATP synthase subunit gamma [Thermoanaerobaculia bacterium]
MPSLKSLRQRIVSVKQTRKITSAMKMVAAAKLRRAQETAEAARPYAERMDAVLASLARSMRGRPAAPAMLVGTGKDEVHLVVVMTADRGLCGSFNSSIVREARRLIRSLQGAGKSVRVLCVGRKGRDQLRRDYGALILETIQDAARPRLGFAVAERIGGRVSEMFQAGEFDACTIVYNKFKSVIQQIVTRQKIIPFTPPLAAVPSAAPAAPGAPATNGAVYEYEPEEEEILASLLPRNLAVQLFRALLENNASEQGARMSAMDNATRNAGDMINRLTLNYNRSRQAAITRELIEIISGAEAV